MFLSKPNGCMIDNMKPIDLSFVLKPKKIQKSNLPKNAGQTDPKTTIVGLVACKKTNRFQPGFRVLVSWGRISGFVFQSGFRDFSKQNKQ